MDRIMIPTVVELAAELTRAQAELVETREAYLTSSGSWLSTDRRRQRRALGAQLVGDRLRVRILSEAVEEARATDTGTDITQAHIEALIT